MTNLNLYLLGFIVAIIYILIKNTRFLEGFGNQRELSYGHPYYNRFHDTHFDNERHYNPNDYKARQLFSRDIIYLI
jgi:hypothetical protein